MRVKNIIDLFKNNLVSIYGIIILNGFLTLLLSQDKCGVIQSPYDRNTTLNWGYSYSDLLEDIEIWSGNPFVLIDSIGATVQNRAIWELTISQFPESNSLKRIYIHARTHPGEEESFWVTDKIINFLLTDTPEADFIRSNTIFHIIPMFNPDGVELGYPRENANGIDIESGWDDAVLEPEVIVLQNRFIELSFLENPIEIALNMHSAYACKRYFVYHHENGTSQNFTTLEKNFISGIQSYFQGGFEDWNYFVSWSNGTPDQYPESWWWFNYGENVMALTYEDMNCDQAGEYDLTARAIVLGACDYLGYNFNGFDSDNIITSKYELYQNYPNPFNSKTTIHYYLPKEGSVKISLYNIKGDYIDTILNTHKSAGQHFFKWNSISSKNSKTIPSGIYFYLLESNEWTLAKKMVLLN